MRTFALSLLLVSLLAGLPATAQVAEKVYWVQFTVDTAAIHRANLNGSNPEFLVGAGMGGPLSVAVDRVGGKIYYGLATANDFGLWRADLDGMNQEELVDTLSPRDVALDISDGKVYWCDPDEVIYRADQDGSNAEPIVAGGTDIFSIDVDGASDHIYWTDANPPRVRRANLDGGNVVDLVTEAGPVDGVTVVPGNGKVYWFRLAPGSPALRRSNLDGSDPETMLEGLVEPVAMDYDPGTNRLFLLDNDTPLGNGGNGGTIYRLNLAGRDVEQVIGDLPPGGDLALDVPLRTDPKVVPAIAPVGIVALVLVVLASGTVMLRRRKTHA